MKYLNFSVKASIKVVFLALALNIYAGEPARLFTPELLAKLETTAVGDKIRINIRLEKQFDTASFGSLKDEFTNRADQRKAVTESLKSFTAEAQREIISFLNAGEKSDKVSEIRSLWIVNVINCYATPDIVAQLETMPGIARIDYDRLQQVLAPEPPISESDILNVKETIAWNVEMVNAPQVWEMGYTGQDVIVAVLDTGVNPDHVDLAGRMWVHPEYPNHGYNFVNNNYDTSDGHSHGTHCAGTVAGNGTAGNATGMAPSATIMALKVLGDDGSGTEAGVWAAIEFAVEHGARVMSLSLGWSHSWNPDRAGWRIAMENAMAAGVIAAVASGNEGSGGAPPPSQVRTPGDCPAPWTHPSQTAAGGNSAVVTVGSVTNTGSLSDFSSKGPVTWQNIAPFNDYPHNPGSGLIVPDVVAPGSNVLSLSNTNNSGYTVKSGTSMATPAVAGIMALMLSKNPNLLPEEISQILEITAIKITLNKSNSFGSGRVDALQAIEETFYDGIRYFSHTINDGLGNDDGFINPGEIISLSISFENPAEDTIADVSVQLFSESEYISILQGEAFLGSFDSLEVVDFDDVFTIQVSETIPGDHVAKFRLIAHGIDESKEWKSTFEEEVFAQHLVLTSYSINDSENGNNNGILDPGETALLKLNLTNTGKLASDPGLFNLSCDSEWVILHLFESLAYDVIQPQQSVDFEVLVSAFHSTPPETMVTVLLDYTSGLYEYETTQEIIVGQAPVFEGIISSTFHGWPNASNNALQPGLLSVPVPQGATITGVDVRYQIISQSGAWISEQRSILKCVSEGGMSETSVTPGPATNTEGTENYNRQGLTIANNVVSNGNVDFELHVFRTWGGSGSNSQYSYVPSGSWKVIVHYELADLNVNVSVVNQLGDSLAGAMVSIANISVPTDEYGQVRVDLPAGQHYYSAEASRHYPVYFQMFEVSETDTLLNIQLERYFAASFQVSDVFENEVENFTITINQEPLDGEVIDFLAEGTYPFKIMAEGYAPYEGDFTISDNDLDVSVIMNPMFKAAFSVIDQWGNQLDNAVVSINDITSEPGDYQFNELLIGSYNYIVKAVYFQDAAGEFDVVNSDVAVDIVMLSDGTQVENFNQNANIRVFPNPASERLFFESENRVTEIRVFDLMGKQLLTSFIEIGKSDLNISHLPSGSFLVEIIGDGFIHRTPIIITRP